MRYLRQLFEYMYISKNSFEQNTRTCTEPRSNFGEGDRFIEIGDEKFKYPRTISRINLNIFLTTTEHPHTYVYIQVTESVHKQIRCNSKNIFA